MKKKLLIFTLLFLLSPFLKVHSASMDSYIDWNLDRGVFAHQLRDGKDHVTNLAMITANGKIAYCIEPGVTADKASYYNSTYNINDTNLSGVDVKRLSLIGYYGYGYEGHGDKRYYMATQELIWRLMGVDDVWWTDQKEGGNIINVDSYKNEILRLVNAYETAPKFEFKDAYIVGDEVVLEDMNNVLSGYEVTSGSASIDGNKINVSVDNKVNNFTLKRKSNGKYPIFYYKNGYQTIGSFESAYEYSKDYVINGKYAKIIVNKKDYDNKSNTSLSQYASLKGASYTLYDKEGNVLSVKETDERGIAIFDNLKKGTYVIKETNSSSGYNIDITRYETYVATSRMEAVINSYEKIIKNKIIVTKVLNDNGVITPEEGIEFGLYYENGTFIDTYVTNKDGVIELNLPYGKYVLKQITKKDGITVASDKFIEVVKEGENQSITITNYVIEKPPIEELPNTGKHFNPSLLIIIISLALISYIYEKKTI